MSANSRKPLLLLTLAMGLFMSAPLLAQTAGSLPERVIVQLRSAATPADKRVLTTDRVRTLAQRTGMPLSVGAGPAPDMHLISAPGISASALAEALSGQDEVLYAVPDRRKQIRRIPNDPRYGEQWSLQWAQPAAINAETAWDISVGSGEVTVAVIDTGVRFDHEDLSERLLPGYDFISDSNIAFDGDGRDTDATDPGDFLSAQDLQGVFQGCGDGPGGTLPTTSSWHGTRVSGVIAATGNNSRGVSGVSWNTRILPVRVMGKCGGLDSDILAAMRWSGGLQVPGAPENPHPAKILNLSLGGNTGCSAPYLLTIEELRRAGVAVVVSAGNSNGGVEEPGNCPGVITVSGLRHAGTKVGFSSYGPEVKISAPAGNCVTQGAGQPCQFQITTTTNLGATTPGANGYSDGQNPTLGTSFSAPLVSGTLALMLSVHPGLAPDALQQRMQSGSRPFPFEDGLPLCPATDAQTGQCNCTSDTCGAGMLDAHGAIQAALSPQARIGATVANSLVTLDGSASSASVGRSLVAWRWEAIGGPTALTFAQPESATTAVQAALPGDYRVALATTDSAGQSDRAEFTLSLSEAAVLPPPPTPPAPEPTPEPAPGGGSGGGGGGGALDFLTLLGLAILAGSAHALRRRRHT